MYDISFKGEIMSKTAVSFRVNGDKWEEFKRVTDNASEELRSYVRETVKTTDGLEEELRNLKEEINSVDGKKSRLEKRAEKIERKIEKRKEIKQKRQEKNAANGLRYEGKWINDEWRSSANKIFAVHVLEPQKCGNCGEKIKNSQICSFDKDKHELFCKDCRNVGTKGTVPAVLMTDLEVFDDEI